MIFSHSNNQPQTLNDSSQHQRFQSELINERPPLKSHVLLNHRLEHPNIHFTNTRYTPYVQQNQSIPRNPQNIPPYVVPQPNYRPQIINNTYIYQRPQILNRETTLKKEFAFRNQSPYQNPQASLTSSPIKVFRASGPPLPYEQYVNPYEPTVEKKYIIIDETEKVKEELRLRPHIEGPTINQSIVKEFYDPQRQAKKHLFESSGYRQKQRGSPCITALIGLILLLGLLTGLYFLLRGVNSANPVQNEVRTSINYKESPTNTNTISSNIKQDGRSGNLASNDNAKSQQISKSGSLQTNTVKRLPSSNITQISNNASGNITSVTKADELKTSTSQNSSTSLSSTQARQQNTTSPQGVSMGSNSLQTQYNTSTTSNSTNVNSTKALVNSSNTNVITPETNIATSPNTIQNASSTINNNIENVSKVAVPSSTVPNTNITNSTKTNAYSPTNNLTTSIQQTNTAIINSSYGFANKENTTKSTQDVNTTLIYSNTSSSQQGNFSAVQTKNSSLSSTNTNTVPVQTINSLNTSSILTFNQSSSSQVINTEVKLAENTTQGLPLNNNKTISPSTVQTNNPTTTQGAKTETSQNVKQNTYNLSAEQISSETNIQKIGAFIKAEDSSSLGENPRLNYATVKQRGSEKSYELSYRNGGREYKYNAYINEFGKPIIQSVRIIQQVFPLHHQLLKNIHQKSHKIQVSKRAE